MEGPTHHFYSLILASVIITIMSGINEGFFTKFLWITIITDVIAVMIYGWANWKEQQDESKGKSDRKSKSPNDSDNQNESNNKDNGLSQNEKIMTNEKWFAFGVLYVNAILVCGLANFYNTEPAIVSQATAFGGLLMTAVGAFMPDWDLWIFSVELHRNPLSHSWVIATAIWGMAIISMPFEWGAFNFLIGMFCLGYGSHLLLDTIPSTSGFFSGIKEFFMFHHAPGDLRHLPEEWEHTWLFCGAIWLFVLFGLDIVRFYGNYGFDFEPINNAGVQVWVPLTRTFEIMTGVAVGIWCILMLIGWFEDKFRKKPSHAREHSYTSEYRVQHITVSRKAHIQNAQLVEKRTQSQEDNNKEPSNESENEPAIAEKPKKSSKRSTKKSTKKINEA